MFNKLFINARRLGVPVSFKEYLDFLRGMYKGVCPNNVDSFYYFAKACLVKDEKYFDRFDQAFSLFLEGAQDLDKFLSSSISEDWVNSEINKLFTKEERKKIQSLGSLEKILEEFKKRLSEQKKRHQGGNKWIGTGGTSPFGNSGYNPEGIRVGGRGGSRSAVKIWEKREYKNLDENITIGIRDIKVALRRLRKFARKGIPDEFDMDNTINSTADNGGYLDIKMRPERKNKIRVLLLLDVGGSMDEYSKVCEELFSAAKTEFKSLDYFYFHNCVYEGLWKDNYRRNEELTPTWEVIRTYNSETRLIFVGDALMSPYEITYPGGSIEHWNEEAGYVWINRLTSHFNKLAWLNPEPEKNWKYSPSNQIIKEILENKMYPLNIKGIDKAMKSLSR